MYNYKQCRLVLVVLLTSSFLFYITLEFRGIRNVILTVAKHKTPMTFNEPEIRHQKLDILDANVVVTPTQSLLSLDAKVDVKFNEPEIRHQELDILDANVDVTPTQSLPSLRHAPISMTFNEPEIRHQKFDILETNVDVTPTQSLPSLHQASTSMTFNEPEIRHQELDILDANVDVTPTQSLPSLHHAPTSNAQSPNLTQFQRERFEDTPRSGNISNERRWNQSRISQIFAAKDVRWEEYRSSKVTHYVSYGRSFVDGRGIGNQMFNLAAVLYVCELSGSVPVIAEDPARPEKDFIEQVFDLSAIKHITNYTQTYSFIENRSLTYDERVERIISRKLRGSNSTQTVQMYGFYQSWKYTRLKNSSLRQYFKFKAEVWNSAQQFLANMRPLRWPAEEYVRVAIHVRRGDFIRLDKVSFGYTVADAAYFERAMMYFVSRHRRVQFIVIAFDQECRTWTKKNIEQIDKSIKTKTNDSDVQVTYAFGNPSGQDMAIMAASDHVIISTGTFGWWGAWLANGTTIYYKNWPLPQSNLSRMFTEGDFFPPHWIPM